MRIKIVADQTGEAVDLSDLDHLDPSDEIEAIERDDTEEEELATTRDARETLKARRMAHWIIEIDTEVQPGVLGGLIDGIRESLGLDDDDPYPDEVEVYYGDFMGHRLYYRVLSQLLEMLSRGGEDFVYKPDVVMSDDDEESDSDDTDKVIMDDDNNAAEEEAEVGNDAVNSDNDEEEDVGRAGRKHIKKPAVEEENDEAPPIPMPQGRPMPHATSERMEQVAARRPRMAREMAPRGNNAPATIKNNFRAPERLTVFARAEPLRQRTDLDMHSFTYKGTVITSFTNSRSTG